MKIALDAMGGDHAPTATVQGALLALKAYPHITKLYLVGDAPSIESLLNQNNSSDSSRVEILHTTEVVDMTDSPSTAVRRKRDSSINRAVELVKDGRAEAIVSAGNTGAAVASTTIKLRMLPGIERPGIATLLPTETNVSVLIDAGANIDPHAKHLLQYGIMGSIYSKHILGYRNPTVGLMSIGTEDSKGSPLTKTAFELLKKSNLNFRGNIEGHDLFENPMEVIVCDGFVGNAVLKTCEATAKAIFTWLKHELTKSPLRKAGAYVAKGAFRTIKKKTNYEEYGGSPLLGVNGICIISHGSSTPLAIQNAIRVASEAISHQVNPHIIEEIARYHEAN